MIIVDTNVLLDLATDDSQWFGWSADVLEMASAADGPLIVNAIIYAELSVRYEDSAAVDEFMGAAGILYADLPRHAGFLAAKTFAKYRLAGGAKTGVLSDFLIGAHASALACPLITRDTRRYRTYFPDVRLISPQMN